jgi:adenylyltransferase/sulfurtransferase
MNDEQLLRYSRQIMLADFDIAGQESLAQATALIVGLGGLGSPVALYLAAAGVHHLMLVDHDVVELSNLQRQVIHRQDSLGTSKVNSAAATIATINPQTQVTTFADALQGQALNDAVAQADVVLDCTDNFQVRYAINDACWARRVPLVSGAAIRWEGQVAVFDPREVDSPCYRCLYAEGDDEALNCAENGVIAPLVGIIGTCQAMEAVKVLSGIGETLAGYILYFDGKRMEWRKLKLPKNPHCTTCAG